MLGSFLVPSLNKRPKAKSPVKRKPSPKTKMGSPTRNGKGKGKGKRKTRVGRILGGAENAESVKNNTCPLSLATRQEITQDDVRKVYDIAYGTYEQCYDLCYLYTHIHSPGTGPNGAVMDPMTRTPMTQEVLWLINARYADVFGDRLCKKHVNSYVQGSKLGARQTDQAPSQQVINALAWQPPGSTYNQSYSPTNSQTDNAVMNRAIAQSIASEKRNAARRRQRQRPSLGPNQASTSAYAGMPQSNADEIQQAMMALAISQSKKLNRNS